MRSQLDCHDHRLPGKGTFDIKTRAALVIRHDRANYEASLQSTLPAQPCVYLLGLIDTQENSAYDIHKLTGLKESFEKECVVMQFSRVRSGAHFLVLRFYDMSRAAFLKYSMQVRIGDMDGIFVAYHNTARIFGFQYISLWVISFAV